MNNKVDYSLYLVTDRSMLKNSDITEAVEAAIKGGVTLVQLREKDISTLEFYNVACAVKKVTDKYGISLIINDRIDIALAVDAAGVHLGQSDLEAAVARRLIGENKILGVSAATLEESLKAEEDGADYLGVGAVFTTTTKNDARTVSLEMLKNIKETVKIPVVAIGGINYENAGTLRECNIDGIAVISDILAKEDIEEAAKTIRNVF
ncbi:MAG: thiamine phosphate synthase [Clostridiaceae bacterium]